jgi:hypothetical protein
VSFASATSHDLLKSALTGRNIRATCGKGHLLTPENLHIDGLEHRWRLAFARR